MKTFENILTVCNSCNKCKELTNTDIFYEINGETWCQRRDFWFTCECGVSQFLENFYPQNSSFLDNDFKYADFPRQN